MSISPNHTLLYQVNTRVWLNSRSVELGRPATFDDISEAELEAIAKLGFDWVYFLGVWQTGVVGKSISRQNSHWRAEYTQTLPDLKEEDICGSPFAITAYTAHENLGGDSALARLYLRLKERGIRLMLDFVPNHTAIDHEWVRHYPEYFMPGTETQLASEPQNYLTVETDRGERILAHGRDPYFPGWPDTLQLNYGDPNLQRAMIAELLQASHYCDGLRCDMAMLVLPQVFECTWGIESQPFWPVAIRAVRERRPDFTFMAEVYWDLEAELLQQGFDYAYDKRLYDLLKEGTVTALRSHLKMPVKFQGRMARFLENHDEARAASIFPADQYKAAALATFLAPGLSFFHQGQLQGYQKKISVHLCRSPQENPDVALETFTRDLLKYLDSPVIRQGVWSLLEPQPAAPDDPTYANYLIYAWQLGGGQGLICAINYSPESSRCLINLPDSFTGKMVHGVDQISESEMVYHTDTLLRGGLLLDLPGWGSAVRKFLESDG